MKKWDSCNHIFKDGNYFYDEIICDCTTRIWTLIKNRIGIEFSGATKWDPLREITVFIYGWNQINKQKNDGLSISNVELELAHQSLGTKRVTTSKLYLKNINKMPSMARMLDLERYTTQLLRQ